MRSYTHMSHNGAKNHLGAIKPIWSIIDEAGKKADIHTSYSPNSTAHISADGGISADMYALEKDAWWRMMSLTMALLEQTHKQLDTAHKHIAEQEHHIHEMKRAASHDVLTDLKNRRGFQEDFSKELDRCKRGMSKGGVLVLIDLDNFKFINDTYGHMAGDACLKLIGNTLAREVRVMDTAARLGGDEFVLLLTNTERKSALNRIQKMSRTLNNLSLIWDGHEIHIRASVGLKAYTDKDNADGIISAADLALYEDKQKKEKVRAPHI